MNANLLGTYLRDHLAGATLATEIIERLIHENEGTRLSTFAKELLTRIEDDERELKSLLDGFNEKPGPFKTFAAWASAKLSAVKLGRMSGVFGNFQALELLAIGILGKRALWLALQRIGGDDERLQALDYDRLIDSAEKQFADVERWRLELFEKALRYSDG